MKRTWLQVALFNFLVAASIGALLRFAFVEEISWMKFRNFLHGHSHIAMLGWVYMALYALLIHAFVPEAKKELRYYNWLFWITQISVAGMMISFPMQGYGIISIAFSTMHILCSYVFAGWIWSDLPKANDFSTKMLKTALVFMIISTLGIWLMGPLMATKLRGSAFYYMAVQFYLHFQFNGWFLCSILALFFKMLENQGINIPLRLLKRFYIFLVISCVLTYALAVAWSQPLLFIFLINGMGVVVQFIALLFFLTMIWKSKAEILNYFSKLEKWLIQIAFFSFVFKILIQASVVIPYIAKVAYTIRNYVIGFIHLMLLGAVSFFLIAYALNQWQLLANLKVSKLGIWLMIIGFALSEFILFLQGTMLWGAKGFLPFYYEMLFGASLFIPIGLLLFWISQFRQKISN